MKPMLFVFAVLLAAVLASACGSSEVAEPVAAPSTSSSESNATRGLTGTPRGSAGGSAPSDSSESRSAGSSTSPQMAESTERTGSPQDTIPPLTPLDGSAEDKAARDSAGMASSGGMDSGMDADSAAAMEARMARAFAACFPATVEGVPRVDGLITVYFSFDRSNLSEACKLALDENAEWLMAHPSAEVNIQGHTDSRGTNEYNLHLSEWRANRVRDYLIGSGVMPQMLRAVPFGEEMPAAESDSEEAWAVNRRVEFRVEKQPEQVSAR